METKNLKSLFDKSAIFHSGDVQSYIISLMSKFEMALVWDKENLLIPSLLPSEQEKYQLNPVKVSLYQPVVPSIESYT